VIEIISLKHDGIPLLVPSCLAEYWPYKMKLEDWPTFCGVSDGLGDKLVPDKMLFNNIFGGVSVAYISIACFIHDICWAICNNTYIDFMISNEILLSNLKSLTSAQLNWIHSIAARHKSKLYYTTASTIGWYYFKKDAITRMTFSASPNNPIVIEKLKRLLENYDHKLKS
jgi:hypothetical protein